MSRPEITLFLLSLFAVTAGWHIRKLRHRVEALEKTLKWRASKWVKEGIRK